jgi:5-formyltetrahydrofolate cyclo-ligase
MTKAESRVYFKEQRRIFLSTNVAIRSRKIAKHFFANFNLENINVVHSFLSISKNKEPDTFQIIGHIWQKKPHVKIVVPYTNLITDEIHNYIYLPNTDLKISRFGANEPQPETSIYVPPQEIDLLIIPLLAFDQKGNRVGYGKGHYDRLLAKCRPDALRIGISFFEPIPEITDVNSYDIPLTHAITHMGVYQF